MSDICFYVDCTLFWCVSVLVLYKTDSASSHSQIMYFPYDIGGKVAPLALNSNHPITFAIDVYYRQIWEFEFRSLRDVYYNICQWLVARVWFSLNIPVSILKKNVFVQCNKFSCIRENVSSQRPLSTHARQISINLKKNTSKMKLKEQEIIHCDW